MTDETITLLFGNTSERLKRALKVNDKTLIDLHQDINILREWIKSQPHLPEMPCK